METGGRGAGDLLRDHDRGGLSGLRVHPRPPAGRAGPRVPVAVAGPETVGPGDDPQGGTTAEPGPADRLSGVDPGQPARERRSWADRGSRRVRMDLAGTCW